jgi:hypothetical protein
MDVESLIRAATMFSIFAVVALVFSVAGWVLGL